MLKVLLIVYVVGGGGSNDIKSTWNTGFEFQEFDNMAQCNDAVDKMEEMVKPWHRGKTDNNISAFYSAECVNYQLAPKGTKAVLPEDVVDETPDPEETNAEPRRHSRWDD